MRANAKPDRNRAAFTIVEMLVVIGIIAILIGLLFPALGAVRDRGRKFQELNTLRQIGFAWNMYSNHHNHAILPGYLDFTERDLAGEASWHDTSWRAPYEFPTLPDHNDPSSRFIPPDLVQPWPWRLYEYLDYDYDTMLGYADDDITNVQELVQANTANRVAYEPAFAYNGFYVGGWIKQIIEGGGGDSGPPTPRLVPRFYDARDVDSNRRVNVVARSQSTIGRPTNLIVFCSAARFDEPTTFRRLPSDYPGTHVVTPSYLGETPQWSMTDTSSISTIGTSIYPIGESNYVPIGRYNGQIALLHADGSTDVSTYGPLLDQRLWIDAADRQDFQHTE